VFLLFRALAAVLEPAQKTPAPVLVAGPVRVGATAAVRPRLRRPAPLPLRDRARTDPARGIFLSPESLVGAGANATVSLESMALKDRR